MKKNEMKFPKKLSDARILVTNDDGIHAPGLIAMENIARSLSKDVWVVAPEVEQSGAGHSLTLHQPLRIREVGPKRYAVSGTPTDCVLMATKVILRKNEKPADIILSGVNRGANLAEDVTYSGTIAATMEGTLLNIPSIAFSQTGGDINAMHWATAEKHAPALIKKLVKIGWPDNTLINVNFPPVASTKVKGIKFAPLGRRQINEKVSAHTDPKGRPYYWIGGPLKDDFDRPGVDLAWISKGYITVTPLYLDLTHYSVMETLREHFESA